MPDRMNSTNPQALGIPTVSGSASASFASSLVAPRRSRSSQRTALPRGVDRPYRRGEQIFRRAIQEQGRGRVLILSAYITARISAWMLTKVDGKFLAFAGTGHTAGDPGAP